MVGKKLPKADYDKNVPAIDVQVKRTSTSRVESRRSLHRSPARVVSSSPPPPPPPVRNASTERKNTLRQNINRRLSPSREPRRQSPAREIRRTSPARAAKAQAIAKNSSYVKKKHITNVLDTDTDSDTIDGEINEKPKATVRGRSRIMDGADKHIPEMQDSLDLEFSSGVILRRNSRHSSSHEIETILPKNSMKAEKLIEFSDEDDIVPFRKSEEKQSKQSDGCIGLEVSLLLCWLMLWLPVLVLMLNLICDQNECTFESLPDSRRYSLSTFFNPSATSVFYAFVTYFAVLNVLPFGGSKVSGLLNKQGKLEYTMNGFFIGVVLLLSLIGLESYGVPAVYSIYKHFFRFSVVSTLFGVLVAVYCYIRSFYIPVSALNPHAITNSEVYNFFMGKEVNPRVFGKLDVKMYFIRYLALSVLIFNVSFVYKALGMPKSLEHIEWEELNVTFLAIAAMQIVFALNMLIYEANFVSSFEVQYEGVGFMSAVGLAAFPYSVLALSKFVLDQDVRLNRTLLVGAIVVFLIGLVLAHRSDSQKNAFRQNPYSPSVAHLDTISTPQGKKLLVSGYWGFVRHPNYLGHILICLSWLPFVSHVPLVLFVCSNIAFLIHRAIRDGSRCREKYGVAWERYCQRVKYTLVPYIF